jgi:hypothetical protein
MQWPASTRELVQFCLGVLPAATAHFLSSQLGLSGLSHPNRLALVFFDWAQLSLVTILVAVLLQEILHWLDSLADSGFWWLATSGSYAHLVVISRWRAKCQFVIAVLYAVASSVVRVHRGPRPFHSNRNTPRRQRLARKLIGTVALALTVPWLVTRLLWQRHWVNLLIWSIVVALLLRPDDIQRVTAPANAVAAAVPSVLKHPGGVLIGIFATLVLFGVYRATLGRALEADRDFHKSTTVECRRQVTDLCEPLYSSVKASYSAVEELVDHLLPHQLAELFATETATDGVVVRGDRISFDPNARRRLPDHYPRPTLTSRYQHDSTPYTNVVAIAEAMFKHGHNRGRVLPLRLLVHLSLAGLPTGTSHWPLATLTARLDKDEVCNLVKAEGRRASKLLNAKSCP